MAKISKKTALLWVLVVAAVLGIWRFIWQPMQMQQEEAAAPTPMMEGETPATPAANNAMESAPAVKEAISEKKAGVRTSYKNPGGEDEVGFSVTVDEAGIITAANVEVLAKNPTSVKRQEAFAAGLPQAIQGKKLSELTAIDKVGGSSLTTDSFNASLALLKTGI